MPKTIGRPRLFTTLAKVGVYVDSRQVPLLQAAAARAGLPLSTWARLRLLEAAGEATASLPATAAGGPRARPRRRRAARQGARDARRARPAE